MRNILIADDHSIVRLGASVIISGIIKNASIVQAETYEEVHKFITEQPFDLLLLDINMPGGNNIRVIKEILEVQPELKILVFSSYDEHLYALRYIQEGACGYLNKNTAMDDLKIAIQSVQERGKYMSDTVRDLYIQKLISNKTEVEKVNPILKLSNREMDVAKHLIDGLGILEVSNKLQLSSSTVSTYKSRVFEKLNVNNIPELIELFKLNED